MTEQTHIRDAFVFELSKVEIVAIRERMLSHLVNVGPGLAGQVAGDLGLERVPDAAEPARPVVANLRPSPALSVARNGRGALTGRKVGALVTDGVDVLRTLERALGQVVATLEIVAPKTGGVTESDGTKLTAGRQVNGGPSVLYDTVAILPSADGARLLVAEASARNFVSDAFAHAKFMGRGQTAAPLFEKAGILETDGGILPVTTAVEAEAFVHACKSLRFWEREGAVHAV